MRFDCRDRCISVSLEDGIDDRDVIGKGARQRFDAEFDVIEPYQTNANGIHVVRMDKKLIPRRGNEQIVKIRIDTLTTV